MSGQPRPFSIETLIDILVADPDRLETHKYAEMGIPMFLVGEDCSGEAPVWPKDNRATSELGDRFAELCGALALRKPALDHDDIAKLLEVLAERHFLTHRTAADETDPFEGSTDLLLPSAAPPVLAEIAAGLARSRAIRLVNFHATPRYREAEYRQQIAHYAELFEPITPANFAEAMEGRWPHARPGLLPALFEGYRDNLDVLLPILEEYGFTGWLFVPSGFLTVPAEEQRSYAAAHELHLPEQDEYPDQRIALTWDEAREIVRRGHAFACHTRTHRELQPDTPREVLEEEITAARAEMERELGIAPDIFCWLEGVPLGLNPEADELLRQAGFRYLISNFKIQRLQ